MSDSTQLAPTQHQAPATQGTKSALGRHQVAVKKPARELAPVYHLSRITPFRVTGLPDGAVIREFWKIGCAPTRSMRSALNDPSVARQMAFITVSSDQQSFKLCFYPHGDAPQTVENLPISRLPEAVDSLLDAGFAGVKRAKPTETLAISV